MKLPPAALTAPSLCPRCDAPAPGDDVCRSCALALRRCASCQGIAGPFDRHCGFCGRELVLGAPARALPRALLVAVLVLLVVLAAAVAALLTRA